MSISLSPTPDLPTPRAPDRQGDTLSDQFLLLRRRWLVLLATLLLVPAVTWNILVAAGPRFTATGILLYDPVDAAPPGNLPPDLGARIQDAVVASQAAIVGSLPAARLLAARLNLTADPEFNAALRRHFWSGWLSAGDGPPDPDAVADAVRSALAVTVPPESNVLSVAFTSADSDVAAAGANMAMQIYLDSQRDQALADLSNEEDWLSGHQAALEDQLAATEAALVRARAAAGIVSGQQVSITTETASQLAASLVDARAQLAMARARLAAAGTAAADAAIAPDVLPLRKEAADLAAQIDGLAGQYGDGYPPLAADRAQLAAIDAALGAETAREIDSARADVAADAAQVATLAAAVAAAKGQAQTQDAGSGPIRALEQRETSQKTLLQSLALQQDQLTQQAALAKGDARILSAASPPDAAALPKRARIMTASLVLGLCLGLLLVQLEEHADTSFRSGGAVRAATGLRCFALVPEIDLPMLAPLTAPLSLYAEQLRAVRTAVTGAGEMRVIAITAARPGEGKTTLTVALARALAAGGLRVAAVDGDVRQPGFDAIFRLGGAAGLTDCLAGQAGLDDILLPDPESPLRVIGAGAQTGDALSLFLSPALPNLLSELRGRFDVVLLDVPPAFALAEARVLAHQADATLLCIRWGGTPSRVVLAAMLLLRESQVKLAGAVLTRVHRRQHKNSGFPDAEMYQPRYGGYFTA